MSYCRLPAFSINNKEPDHLCVVVRSKTSDCKPARVVNVQGAKVPVLMSSKLWPLVLDALSFGKLLIFVCCSIRVRFLGTLTAVPSEQKQKSSREDDWSQHFVVLQCVDLMSGRIED